MSIGFYISHPEVSIDPGKPVPTWGLSDLGRRRLEAVGQMRWLQSIKRVMSSEENKAIEAAAIVSGFCGAPVTVISQSGEVDRSSTGYVSQEKHERLADELFTWPTRSASGWETAAAAQSRIVNAVEGFIQKNEFDQNIAIVGHGAVGTFLSCALANEPIVRALDQESPGSVFLFDLASRKRLLRWTVLEKVQTRMDQLKLNF